MRSLPSFFALRLNVAFTHRQEGSALIELALLLPVFVMLLVGSIDFGRAFYASIEVASAAQAAACYGTQQPSDLAGMRAAAALDASEINNLTTNVSTGCQCADGSSVQPGCQSPPTSCTANIVTYVQVTTSSTYSPMLHYPGLPATFNLQGNARMRTSY